MPLSLSSKNLHSYLVFFITALIGFYSSPRAHAILTPENLRCEYKSHPLAIEAAKPRLFWIVTSRERSARQSAYRILAASTEGNLGQNKGDLWDSGKVASSETIQVEYGGKTLNSSQPVFWKVQVWDGKGIPSVWSRPATWTMGLLKPSDWKAAWIAPKADTRTEEVPSLAGAQWIWFDGDGANPPAGTRYFQQTFRLADDARIARAALSLSGRRHMESGNQRQKRR